ncbi:hypothetical protein JTB14_011707 [Gonioctena quinquepunctata]|nr:hypothetical protein JTB14_011707 [Gonioctena quinquepunctata]
MFALVRFSDNTEGIYPMKNIKRNVNLCIVKHKGCKFEAELLAVEDIEENLVKPVLQELENVSAANVEEPSTSETREFTQGTTEIIQVTFEDTSVNENESFDLDVPDFEDNSFDDPDYEPEENEIIEQNNETNVLRNLNIEQIEEKENLSSSFNVSGFGCDDTNMYVPESRGKSGSEEIHFCFYCKTKQRKIARHLELIHKDVEEVQKFVNLPKGNAEGKAIIAEIRREIFHSIWMSSSLMG